jgi:WD40 repeat protein/serine/threonine protein kinase
MKLSDAEHIFHRALEFESGGARAAYLDSACGGNSPLRAQVEQLLAAHGAPAGFLDTLPEDSHAVTASVEEALGSRIGRYKLLEKVGEGGWGVVYVAEQTEPVRRRVALKVIKLGMDTKAVVARFEAERQALAMMDHPNIAKVLDAGTTGVGRPYFVMELVRGIRITDYCDQNNLTTDQRLDLFIRVCQAIQHAHQKGIIHRDIKPSNILVTLHDGVPVPKVIDFGIAKATDGRLTDATVYTQLHQFIGTPAYMSPEQAEMSGLDIDTRSDIYSLGVLLYELLTGITPFDADELIACGLDAMRKTIREKEPVRPSTRLATLGVDALTTTARRRSSETSRLLHQLKGDLDWIVMKCLEKDRTRRYETANGLAADLKRHLNNEPVTARPPSTAYRFQKAWRRNKLAFTAATSVAAALLLGSFLSAWQALRATHAERQQAQLTTVAEKARASEASQRAQAEAAQANETRLRKLAELEAYAADMKAVQTALDQNNRGQAAVLLNRYRPRPGEEDLRGIEWRYLWQLARGDEAYTWQHPSMVMGLRISPDGRFLVTACFDGLLRVWDFDSRRLIGQIERGIRDERFTGSICFSPDGQTLASSDRAGLILINTRTWQLQNRLASPAGAPPRQEDSSLIAFSRDGSRIAATWDRGLALWNLADGTSRFRPDAEMQGGRTLSFTADGQTLIGPSLRALDLHSLSEISLAPPALASDRTSFGSFALRKNGSQAIVGGWIGAISLWDLPTGQLLWTNQSHQASVPAVALSPDEKLVATGSFDQTIHLLDAANGKLLRVFRGHLNEVWSVAFSPDGRWLISSGKDGTARLWDLQRAREPRQWWLNGNLLGFDSAGTEPVTRTTEGLWQYWNSTNIVRSLSLPPGPAVLSPDSRRFLIMPPGDDRAIKTFNEAGAQVASIPVKNLALSLLALSADNRWLCLLKHQPQTGVVLEVWNAGSGEVKARCPDFDDNVRGPLPLAFSADGQLMAYSNTNLDICIWNVAEDRLLRSLKGNDWHVNAVAFSTNNLLASGSWDGTARIWDLVSGKIVAGPLLGHGSGVTAVTFSPDGKTLLTAGDDNTVRFWHVATGREMLVFPQSNTDEVALLSPSGERLVVWDRARSATRLERIPTLAEIAIEEGRE